MFKFLAGALVVFLYYNQANIQRGYYIVMHEINRAQRAIEAEKRSNFKSLKGEAPMLKTSIEVQEPTLDQMESLGFKVKRQ